MKHIMPLKDKVTVITGAASVRCIGKATSRLFAEHSARLAILDLNADPAIAAAADIGSQHLGISCDVTNEAACERAAKAVFEGLGRVDELINNARVTQRLKVIDIQHYELVTDVRYRERFT